MEATSKDNTAPATSSGGNGSRGNTTAITTKQDLGHHHHLHGRSDAQEKPDIDCRGMHKQDALEAKQKLAHDHVHHYEGQLPNVAEHAQHVLQDPHSPADAKLNALDDAEALPHGGYLRGDC
ncbi:hypothetical protein JCM10908_005080 [Rhodotorula pacifica]|uniref:uncharacterized protein n=1 Tax=Rhodotorula pacifica TaxID=1495444 RepID=UPI00316F0594